MGELQQTGTAADLEKQGRVLPTSLFGFRKKDVLSAMDDLIRSRADLEKDLSSRLAQLQQQNAETSELLSAAKKKAEDAGAQLQSVRQTNTELTARNDALQTQGDRFRARLFDAQKEISAAHQQNTSMQAQLNVLQKQADQAQKDLAELGALRTRAAESDRLAGEARAKNSELAAQVDERDRRLADWQAKLPEIEKARSEAENEAVRLRSESQAAAGRSQEAARRAAVRIVSEANLSAAKIREDAEAAQRARLEAAALRSSEIERSVDELCARLSGAEQQIDRAYADLRDAESRIRSAVGRVQSQSRTVAAVSGGTSGEPSVSQPQAHPDSAAPQPHPAGETVRVAPHEPSAARPSSAGGDQHGRSFSDVLLDKLARLLG